MADAIVVRYSEIFLKKGRRRYFENVLARNIRHALRWMPGLRVAQPHARIFVDSREEGPLPQSERALACLQRVFGIENISPVWRLDPNIEPDDLLARAQEVADPWFSDRQPGGFRVTANRADKRFPIRSMEINRRLGAMLATGHPDWSVNLDEPDLTVGVEIRPDRAFVYGDVRPGPGGLPVGSSGRVLLLMSGGIDSPVAGYLALKRGCVADAVYFHSAPFTGEGTREKVVELAQVLALYQRRMSLYVVPFAAVQQACRDSAPGEQLVLLYRRFMFRIAERLGAHFGSQALVTGESLGQVASQTLPNLHAIGQVARGLVIRPLITYDKAETKALAARIGTYDISIRPFDDCCSLFVPRHPELSGDPEQLARLEADLDAEALIQQAVDATEVVEFTDP